MNKNMLWYIPTLTLMGLVEIVYTLTGNFVSFQNFIHMGAITTLVIGIHQLGSPK